MDELISARSYTRKVFKGNKYDSGDLLSKRFHFHAAQIHYKNERGDFEDIDTRLTFDNGKWKQAKASYHCSIPEYADGEFEFFNAYEGVNHTIKAIPQAAHVKGVMTSHSQKTNIVTYKDAFGKGIDLEVTAYHHGLRKVIRINEKPKDIKDVYFDFELILDNDSEVVNKENVVWNKSSKIDFKNKTLRVGKDNRYSYFKNARVWDSVGADINCPVDIEIYTKGEKTYLRKTITKDILEKAVYPLYTDHPTSYYSGSGDGTAYRAAPGSWDEGHDAASGDVDKTSTTQYIMSRYKSADNSYWIYRGVLMIDTSGIADDATITSASLYCYKDGIFKTDDDGDNWITVVHFTGGTSIDGNDYNNVGDTVDNPTEGIDSGDRLDCGSESAGAYYAFPLNATGIGWISKTGTTTLGLREGHDCLDHAIAAVDGFTGMRIRYSEYADTSSDPYLDVTVAGGAVARNRHRWIGGGW